MSKQIDHAAEAAAVVANYGLSSSASTADVYAYTQVHATLAVAEQQKRIADFLEALPVAHDDSIVFSVNGAS